MILNVLKFGADTGEAGAAGATPAAGPVPLVLLHGLFGAAKNLGVLARALARRTRVYALDMRNHGASAHAADMDYATQAADVAETMAFLGIGAAGVVGHSMGGKAAMALALTRPALVTRLAVLDVAPLAYRHSYDAYAAAMRAIPLTPSLTRHQADAALSAVVPEAPLRSFLLNNLILGDAPHWRVGLEENEAAMPQLIGWREPDDATPYHGPALFLRGETSDYVPDEAVPGIMARFPNARVETVAKAGHWLHAERPAAVVAMLEAFLFGGGVIGEAA